MESNFFLSPCSTAQTTRWRSSAASTCTTSWPTSSASSLTLTSAGPSPGARAPASRPQCWGGLRGGQSKGSPTGFYLFRPLCHHHLPLPFLSTFLIPQAAGGYSTPSSNSYSLPPPPLPFLVLVSPEAPLHCYNTGLEEGSYVWGGGRAKILNASYLFEGLIPKNEQQKLNLFLKAEKILYLHLYLSK